MFKDVQNGIAGIPKRNVNAHFNLQKVSFAKSTVMSYELLGARAGCYKVM